MSSSKDQVEDLSSFKVTPEFDDITADQIESFLVGKIFIARKRCEVPASVAEVLKKYTAAQLLLAKTLIAGRVPVKKVGPFRVGNVMIEQGFSIVPQVDDKGKGVIEVSRGEKVEKLPVVNAKVDTNKVKEFGIEVTPYQPTVARVASIASFFYEQKSGGISVVQHDSAALKMVEFDRIVPGANGITAVLSDVLQKCVAASKNPVPAIRGLEFTDYLYNLLWDYGRPELHKVLTQLSNGVACLSGKQKVPYILKEGNKVTFRSPMVSLPKVVNGEAMDVNNVSYAQALSVLHVTRPLRGSDEKERGGIPRMAYSSVELSSLYSETAYWLTDLRRLGAMDAKRLVVLCRKDVTTIKQILMALDSVEQELTVVLAGDVAPSQVGKLAGTKYTSSGGLVKLAAANLMTIRDEVKDGDCVIDIRDVYKSSGKITVMIEGQAAAVRDRLVELSGLKGTVWLRGPLVDAVYDRKIVPSVRAHNLIGWIGAKENGENTSLKMLKHVWYSSIVANILRSYRAFHVLPLPVIAKQMRATIEFADIVNWKGKIAVDSFYTFAIDGEEFDTAFSPDDIEDKKEKQKEGEDQAFESLDFSIDD